MEFEQVVDMADPPSSGKTGSSLTDSVPDKVVLVGDVGVGKTSLFLRFKTGQFQHTTPSHNPRDGEHQKEWPVGGRKVSVSSNINNTNQIIFGIVAYMLFLTVLCDGNGDKCVANPKTEKQLTTQL